MANKCLTQTDFAASIGVSGACVSQWLRDGKIDGEAIVRVGRRIKIRPALARKQLRGRLDVAQRVGGNGRARLGDDPAPGGDDAPGAPPDATVGRIQLEKLRQLELANATAQEAALARSGRFVERADVEREMGRIAARAVAGMDGALPALAEAIAAASSLTQREALHVLRTAWRQQREKLSDAAQAQADALPELIEAAE